MERASILLIGHPAPEKIEFGADHCSGFSEALVILKESKYPVVVAKDQPPGHYDFLKACREMSPDTQTILVSSNLNPLALQKVINDVGLFKVIPDFETSALQLAVREALEEYELIKQNQAFLALTQEQNQKLQHLSALLEEKVKAREAFLVEAREKLLKATRRTEALNRALVTIQKSVSKQEIEQHLKDALHVALGLSWTKILIKGQTYLETVDEKQTANLTVFSAPLLRNNDLLGHIYFARDRQKPFSTDEDDFLLQITDAVALAIDRLMALEAIESLKKEWDSTFDAITDPLSIIGADYQIIRTNASFARRSGTDLHKITDKKCFEVLFRRSKPCEQCRLGQSFQLGEVVCADETQAYFSVSSHIIDLPDAGRSYAMFYRDVSEEQRIQRQILESSKMAEIGTIGSSIAHEINNPLGGMIAFLQILKGEITTTDKIYNDVNEMEQAAIRCKTIVENLLAFTRKSFSGEGQITRLGELVKLVTNIIELQTRGLGIQIETHVPNSDIKIQGDKNQLVQVLVNVMQNSCEAIAERMSAGKRSPPGKIAIRATLEDPTNESVLIEITDNGTGIPQIDLPRVFSPFFTTKDKTKNPGLGLSVGYQIVKEHGGQMEISAVTGQSTTVLITLPVAKSPTI